MAEDRGLKAILGRLMMVVFICLLLVSSIIYLNRRWEKIRDIRRAADAQTIVKALDFYNFQLGEYPVTADNDGEGWDKSNDQKERTFLEPLVKLGLLPSLVFDPKNDADHYYRYQKFTEGDFGCDRSFAVFQITSFEDKNNNPGRGECPEINWVKLAPQGYTWFSLE